MSRIDSKFAALREQGFTGAVSDMTLQWLQANGATSNSIPTAWMEMLFLQGYTGQRNDAWFQFLFDRGYEGAYPDRDAAFWEDGGFIGDPLPPVDLDNVYQGFGAETVTFTADHTLDEAVNFTVALRVYVIEHTQTVRALVSQGANWSLSIGADDALTFTLPSGSVQVSVATGRWVTVAAQWVDGTAAIATGDDQNSATLAYAPTDSSGAISLLGGTLINAQMARVAFDYGDNEYRFVAPCAEGEGLVSLDYSRFRLEGVISDEIIHQTRLEDLVPPTIDVPPSDLTVTEPDPATFSVVASHPTEQDDLFYQWMANIPGTGWINVQSVWPGRTVGHDTDTFTLDPTEAEDTDSVIACRVRAYENNGDYQILSPSAVLTVEAAAGEEYFHDFTTGEIGDWTHTRGSIATAPDADGIIQTYTGNEPAFYRDQGLQLEAESANTARDSLVIPNGDYWFTGGAALETDEFHATIPAPDGTFTARHLASTADGHVLGPDDTSAIGDTVSIYARALPGQGGGTAQILRHSSVTDTLFTLTEEWQRFTYTLDGSGTAPLQVYPVDFRAGTLNEVLLWGVQDELQIPFTTSLIPTSGTQVTRNDTECQATFAELGAPLPAGGLTDNYTVQIVWTMQQDWGQVPQYTRIFSMILEGTDSSTTTESFEVLQSESGRVHFERKINGVAAGTSMNLNGEPLRGTRIDLRLRIGPLGLGMWRDGVKQGTDSSDFIGAHALPINFVVLGKYPGHGARIANINYDKVRILPYAASDEEIEGWPGIAPEPDLTTALQTATGNGYARYVVFEDDAALGDVTVEVVASYESLPSTNNDGRAWFVLGADWRGSAGGQNLQGAIWLGQTGPRCSYVDVDASGEASTGIRREFQFDTVVGPNVIATYRTEIDVAAREFRYGVNGNMVTVGLDDGRFFKEGVTNTEFNIQGSPSRPGTEGDTSKVYFAYVNKEDWGEAAWQFDEGTGTEAVSTDGNTTLTITADDPESMWWTE